MKKVFKLNVILLLVLILISANIGLKASHIVGAEISYNRIEGNLYHFTLRVYRDCKECKFNNNGGGSNGTSCSEVPNLKVKGALNSLYSGFDFGEIVLTRTRIEDKTPTCYSSVSKCRNGSTVIYGYELHEFEGTFNFNNLVIAGKCQFDVSIGMSSRNASINSSITEQNFFNYAYINLCNSSNNQSTRFELPPVFSLIQNQTHSIALGIVNDDNDSLSFRLKSALVNRSQDVVYSIGKSYSQPYSVYCSTMGCPPNPNAPVAEGFYISNLTGDVVFTPVVLSEGGVIVVECEEWKKDIAGNSYLAGITRRDIYAEVITPTNNLPKIKNNELILSICEGDPFSFHTNMEDLKWFSAVSDSINVNVISTFNDLVLVKKNLFLPPYHSFHIDLFNTINKAGKYYITINAEDNNCPLKGSFSKTILLSILQKRKLEYTYKTKNCGVLQIESKVRNSNIRWGLYDLNNRELIKQIGTGFNYQLTSGGSYILKATLDATGNLCAVNIEDTILVMDFKKPEFDLGPDLLVCKNSYVSLDPLVLNTSDLFEVILDNSKITFPYSYKAIDNKNLVFRVMQNNGCFSEQSIKINVHPELSRQFLKDTVCSNLEGFDVDNLILTDKNKIDFIDIATPNSEISLDKTDNLNWNAKILIPGNNKLKFTSVITDIKGCNYLDTFYLEMVNPKPINLILTDKICANANSLTLPSMLNGIWKCINYPFNITGKRLNIQPPYNGIIELEYTEINKCTNSKKYFVSIIDTTAINVFNGSKLVLCENAAPVILNASPVNGNWEGSFVNQNIFYPSSAGNTNNFITYNYINAEGCLSTAKMSIEVIALPELTIESNKSTICVGDELKLTAHTGNAFLDGYWFSNGDGRFDYPDKNLTTYIPSKNDIQKGVINFIYTIQTNTICGNISKGIDISILEGPTGKIIPDYSLNKCEPAEFQFQTNFTNATKQNWFINDSLIEEFDYPFGVNMILNAGTYLVKTQVMNGECSAIAFSEMIEVYSTPSSNFIASPGYRLSREYPRLHLKDVTKNKNPFSSQWYFNNLLVEEGKEFYYNVETPLDTFSIKLVNVSTVGGCNNSVTKRFLFTPINQLYIPDAFTPDTKGPVENNVFKIEGPPMQFFYIEIFNKWGEIVYNSKDMNMSWDGTYGGKQSIAGVYFYKINSTDTDGISRDYSGTVTLMR